MAKIIKEKQSAKVAHRKDDYALTTYSVMDADKKRCLAEIRIYYRSFRENVYACFWLLCENYTSGSGYAGGYGYHKGSGAASAAIESAGIKLDAPIHGRGDSAIETAMEEIAKDICKSTNFFIYRTHN